MKAFEHGSIYIIYRGAILAAMASGGNRLALLKARGLITHILLKLWQYITSTSLALRQIFYAELLDGDYIPKRRSVLRKRAGLSETDRRAPRFT